MAASSHRVGVISSSFRTSQSQDVLLTSRPASLSASPTGSPLCPAAANRPASHGTSSRPSSLIKARTRKSPRSRRDCCRLERSSHHSAQPPPYFAALPACPGPAGGGEAIVRLKAAWSEKYSAGVEDVASLIARPPSVTAGHNRNARSQEPALSPAHLSLGVPSARERGHGAGAGKVRAINVRIKCAL